MKKNSDLNSQFLKKIIDIGKNLFGEESLKDVLNLSIDSIISSSGAERGLILLFENDDQVIFETARNINKTDIEDPEFEISQTIINKAKMDKKPLIFKNALDDPTLDLSDSILQLKILSVIVVPLFQKKNLFGVVYLDNRKVEGIFNNEIFQFIVEFSNFISLAVYNALERKRLLNRISSLEKELREKYKYESIIGHHPSIIKILKLVSQVADTDAPVIIEGESGTGKELIARAIHYNSKRKKEPFVPINCGALSEHLLESELFGHVKGAFTNAHIDKVGWFTRANTGTIFLDEIGEMSTQLQIKLLRVLQTGEYCPVGTTEIRYCDVRIIAATNKKLRQLVESGNFREDVYFRLNVINIQVPPLRERKSDIALLIHHFLNEFNKMYNKKLHLSHQTELILFNYDFKGNVRELENIIHHAVILAEHKIIDVHHLPEYIYTPDNVLEENQYLTLSKAKRQALDHVEQSTIIHNLKVAGGNVNKAAELTGIDLSYLYKILKKHAINPEQFKK